MHKFIDMLLKAGKIRLTVAFFALVISIIRTPDGIFGIITGALAPLLFFVIAMDLFFATLYYRTGEESLKIKHRNGIFLNLLMLTILFLSFAPIYFF